MILHTCTNTSFEGRNSSSQVKPWVVEDQIIFSIHKEKHTNSRFSLKNLTYCKDPNE